MRSPGVIVFYLPKKGYGYVRLEGTREEFHFRREHVVGEAELRAGDVVGFVLKEGKRGWYADKLEKATLA